MCTQDQRGNPTRFQMFKRTELLRGWLPSILFVRLMAFETRACLPVFPNNERAALSSQPINDRRGKDFLRRRRVTRLTPLHHSRQRLSFEQIHPSIPRSPSLPPTFQRKIEAKIPRKGELGSTGTQWVQVDILHTWRFCAFD